MLWMAAPAGCPEVGQRFLRQVRFCHTDRNEIERAPGFVLTNVSNALWQATRQFYGPEFYSGDEDNGSMAAATWQWTYLHAFEVRDVLDELELVGGTWEDHEEEHDCAVHHADAVDGHGRRDGENPVKRVLHLAPP